MALFDATPGLTALNAQLPAILQKLTDAGMADEAALIRAASDDLQQLETWGTGIVTQIVTGLDGILDKRIAQLFAGLDARLPPFIPVWKAPGPGTSQPGFTSTSAT